MNYISDLYEIYRSFMGSSDQKIRKGLIYIIYKPEEGF